ncbi:hypothetical protein PanWU01x14_021220 [Parasponia andersonii]|uniref:Uncharacterized protein n=1 Tax=Parasponia andersonii TaxID=3476 RepID=A0A2P5DXZ0_PARAD|nr:hypothetical protein PanWU01x14_021220 [Parasponia andersonii]
MKPSTSTQGKTALLCTKPSTTSGRNNLFASKASASPTDSECPSQLPAISDRQRHLRLRAALRHSNRKAESSNAPQTPSPRSSVDIDSRKPWEKGRSWGSWKWRGFWWSKKETKKTTPWVSSSLA